jgi:regulator of sigma E protease
MLSSILILAVAFLSLIVLMVIHEFGHFIIAKKFGVRVDEFGVGYPPRIFGKKIGETIYSINLLPLGAFVRIYGEEGGLDDYRSFSTLKIWKRVLIVVGGVAAFWIAAIIIFSIVFAMGADIPVGDQEVSGLADAQVKIVMVSMDSPASEAGLKSADTIKEVKIGDSVTQINKIADFQKITEENKGKEITITVNRNGQNLNFNLVPRVSPPAGEGSVGIGLDRMATLIKKYPWYLAPVQGVVYTWQTTVNALVGFYQVLANLVSGKGAPEGASFAGPLGITVFLANAASYGAGFFLYFIGLISVFIAIFNLFPIPALDGGKLIFLLIEKIKGKPVSAKVEQSITVVFFLLLITLSIFITVKFDIPRFTDFLKSALQR